MRIACLIIRNIAVQLAVAEDPSLQGQPLVIGGLPFEAKPVRDASAQAITCGIRVGMPLREAYALCPTANFLPLEESRCGQAFEHVVNVLEKFSPIVDVKEAGCAYIDISGIRDEAGFCRDILRNISVETGLSGCLGVSSGKFFSYVAAFTSKPEMTVIVESGHEEDFVAPFSTDFLPCSDESKERLRLLGIHFIGELTNFPREALAAQFGSDGFLMYDLAHGVDGSPLIPRAKQEVIADSITLDYPALSFIEILRACEITLSKLLPRATGQGKSCREVTLKLTFPSGKSEERRLFFKEPVSSSRPILSRLQTWLETARLPSPVVGLALSLFLTSDQGKMLSLWSDQKREEDWLTRMAQELKLRFGYQPIKKSKVVNPQPILPERRFILTDVLE
jgi:nucleotidyltransferase/DNA polymerase involved in DNA repair